MSRVPLLNIAEKVVLDERVDAIRRLLLDVAAFGERRGEWQGLVLRFAGGWVRDLILGIRSNDIDVALSSTTGVQFVTTLKAFVDECSNLESYGLSEDDLGRIYIVAANPEKSKQLETAAMELKGQDLDFVNLRKEVYDPQSRTPRMEFGTAKEDALRRDATINALFYNLHSQMVEDFTTGIQDMGNKLIRTPLDPQQTFTDDPLRVLRLIRFASRLDFAIDSDTRIWMGDETIREAFLSKISRERVDQEITKMFKDVAPRRALVLFDELELYSTIFTTTDPSIRRAIDTSGWSNAYNCLQELLENDAPKSLRQQLVNGEKETSISWLLACLAPLAQVPLPDLTVGVKQLDPYITHVTRQGIKQDNKICALITGSARHREEIQRLKDSFVAGESYSSSRDKVGMAIRRWQERGGQWKLQVVFSILVEAMQRGSSTNKRIKLLAEWQTFVDQIEELGLFDAASRRPIIDGKLLQQQLGVKSGKWMKDALDVCMAWQFRNPSNESLDGPISEVRSRHRELGIPLK